jgi:hypothetical protein
VVTSFEIDTRGSAEPHHQIPTVPNNAEGEFAARRAHRRRIPTIRGGSFGDGALVFRQSELRARLRDSAACIHRERERTPAYGLAEQVHAQRQGRGSTGASGTSPSACRLSARQRPPRTPAAAPGRRAALRQTRRRPRGTQPRWRLARPLRTPPERRRARSRALCRARSDVDDGSCARQAPERGVGSGRHEQQRGRVHRETQRRRRRHVQRGQQPLLGQEDLRGLRLGQRFGRRLQRRLHAGLQRARRSSLRRERELVRFGFGVQLGDEGGFARLESGSELEDTNVRGNKS